MLNILYKNHEPTFGHIILINCHTLQIFKISGNISFSSILSIQFGDRFEFRKLNSVILFNQKQQSNSFTPFRELNFVDSFLQQNRMSKIQFSEGSQAIALTILLPIFLFFLNMSIHLFGNDFFRRRRLLIFENLIRSTVVNACLHIITPHPRHTNNNSISFVDDEYEFSKIQVGPSACFYIITPHFLDILIIIQFLLSMMHMNFRKFNSVDRCQQLHLHCYFPTSLTYE
jgi:hypothetical protein